LYQFENGYLFYNKKSWRGNKTFIYSPTFFPIKWLKIYIVICIIQIKFKEKKLKIISFWIMFIFLIPVKWYNNYKNGFTYNYKHSIQLFIFIFRILIQVRFFRIGMLSVLILEASNFLFNVLLYIFLNI
jgi:hypothetical protein